ncbi:hypothetical protein BX600DRAFT_518435 [Xylariales sp. PMI_506]|nr:hypothetical protein BX600DRAFT_518435 [Xylariales sp. PMI_506]
MGSLVELIYGGPMPQQKRKEPMQILCVGISRSGTESLREALTKLGYPTYHGWDTLLPPRFQLQSWYQLCKRKYDDHPTGAAARFTAADFDPIIGHCTAIADLPAAVFAAELIAAYPDAQVILNKRDDLDAWYRSFDSTIGVFDRNPINMDWVLSWFSRDLFWIRQCMSRTMVPRFFRGSFAKNGKDVYRDHVAAIRGLDLPPSRCIEWSVEDGWEPLCKFLGKPVPDEPFPAGNTPDDWARRAKAAFLQYYATAVVNILLLTGAGVAVVAYATGNLQWSLSDVPGLSRLLASVN